jgi:hypothetical protein
MRRILTILAAGTIALSACSDDNVSGPSDYYFVVVPDQAELTLTQDDSVFVSAMLVDTVSGGHMSSPELTWTSDDPDVAVAEETDDGWMVRAVGGGETQIHIVFDAAAGPVEASIPVSVTGVPATAFTLDESPLALHPGDVDTLRITIKDAEGNDLSLHRIKWENADDSVASVEPLTRVWTHTVSEDSVVTDSVTYYAVITAADTGATEITATVGTITRTIAVTVAERPVDTITLTPDVWAFHVGETVALAATLKGANGETLTERAILWATSDITVATVDQHGTVTATGPGTATIIASSGSKEGMATVFVED